MKSYRQVTWTSKLRVSELEGYVLSVYIRIHASGMKLVGDRNTLPPTLLTKEIAAVIVGPYAFTMDAVFRGEVKNVKEVEQYMSVSSRSEEAGAWVYHNDPKIEKAEKRLADLVGDFRCIG